MFHRQPVALYCLCMGVGLLGVLGSLLPIFSDAEENLGLDLLYILRGPEKTRADVLVVAIDSQSAGARRRNCTISFASLALVCPRKEKAVF